jgi:SAM-dependent methyltransferase
MKAALYDTICPNCRHKLQISSDAFFCPHCQRVYSVQDGVPILLKEQHFTIQEGTERKPVSSLRKWIRRLLETRPDPQCSTATRANVKDLATRLTPKDQLLFVGGGLNSYGKYMNELGTTLIEGCINLEIARGPIVDLIADGHDIPFPDNYFGAIICQAVLEHTRNSDRVVSEMHRVLKPGGIVYAEVPFLYPVHMKSDFRRFTLMGVEELFGAFDTIRVGVNGAVASSFVVLSTHFFATLLSFGNNSLYQVGRFVFGWLFFPIKYLDWILCRYPMAPVSTSAIYFMGQKKN